MHDESGPARVGIITRTRNRGMLLRRTLASIAAQTFTDYEVVIVNDAGRAEDVTEALATMPADAAGRVRVVHNEVSQGREAAVNVGFAATEAPLVAVLDDDDTWDPGFLAATVRYLDENPEAVAVATRCEVVRERLEDDGTATEVDSEILATDLSTVSILDLLHRNHVPPVAMVIRHDAADAVGGWNGRRPVLADWEFNLKLALRGPIGFIDGPPLARWHHRTTDDPDLGNSIVVDADEHRSGNMLIRDEYLRKALADERLLGIGLLVGELTHQMSVEHRSIAGDLARHLDVIYLDLRDNINRQGASAESMVSRTWIHFDALANRVAVLDREVNLRIDELNRKMDVLVELQQRPPAGLLAGLRRRVVALRRRRG